MTPRAARSTRSRSVIPILPVQPPRPSALIKPLWPLVDYDEPFFCPEPFPTPDKANVLYLLFHGTTTSDAVIRSSSTTRSPRRCLSTTTSGASKSRASRTGSGCPKAINMISRFLGVCLSSTSPTSWPEDRPRSVSAACLGRSPLHLFFVAELQSPLKPKSLCKRPSLSGHSSLAHLEHPHLPTCQCRIASVKPPGLLVCPTLLSLFLSLRLVYRRFFLPGPMPTHPFRPTYTHSFDPTPQRSFGPIICAALPFASHCALPYSLHRALLYSCGTAPSVANPHPRPYAITLFRPTRSRPFGPAP
jgi:hypothetical protein